ncbi:MAG: hypothetical protein RLZZ126_625, partial [Pseudomonadota bacterium]
RIWDLGSEHSLSLPHERLLAGGWPDGLIPQAAWHALELGCYVGERSQGWAFITPCHWTAQANSILLADPLTLHISEAESRSLLEAMKPYFLEDGIHLRFDEPGRWLARSDLFTHLPTAHPDRAVGRSLLQWLPSDRAGDAGRTLRRLQNEMQMLLYNHPVNDARAAQGLPVVNSFWISGTGAMDPAEAPPLRQPMPHMITTLRAPALQEDWAAWSHAWQQLDAGLFTELATRLQQAEDITLSVCGERGSVTCVAGRKAWWRGLRGIFDRNRGYFPNIDAHSKL